MKEVKVYLAGPDVFYPNAIELGNEYIKIAKGKGLIGLFPLDNKVDINNINPDLSIYKFNKELIDSADYIVANLNDFRGNEPDSGTVWEVAYAIGTGKKVVAYMTNTKAIVDRIKEKEKVTEKNGYIYDKNGLVIENFGNPLNLMLQHSVEKVIEGDIEDALNEIVKIVNKQK